MYMYKVTCTCTNATILCTYLDCPGDTCILTFFLKCGELSTININNIII